MASSFDEAFRQAGFKTAQKKLDQITVRTVKHCKTHISAMEHLFGEVESNAELLIALIGQDALLHALRKQIARFDKNAPWRKVVKVKQHARRQPGEVAPRLTAEPTAADLAKGRAARRNSILATFMVNGQPLGKVTAGELIDWGMARGRDSDFARELAAGVPENVEIGAARTEDEVSAVWVRHYDKRSAA